EASIMKAHAYARLRNEEECTKALTEAEVVFGQADRSGDPHWIGYLDGAYLAAISGHCFRALGQRDQAERFVRRSLEMNNGYIRGRLFNTLLLASSCALGPRADVDQACAIGHEALDLAGSVSSARAITYIDRLVRQLRPWGSDQKVKELEERAKSV